MKGYSLLFLVPVIALEMCGCAFPDLPNEGPLCDQGAVQEWTAAPRIGMEMDPLWPGDPDLAAYLEAYGMAGPWAGGKDLVEESAAKADDFEVTTTCDAGPCLPVSPRAKMLSALELLATSFPGWQAFDPYHSLEDFEYHDDPLKWFAAYVMQDGTPQLMACGPEKHGRTAINYRRGRRREVVYYEEFFTLDVVRRTSVIVHEAGHSYGRSHAEQDSSKDLRWGGGPYGQEVLYLVALSVADHEHRAIAYWAEKYAREILKGRFVTPTTWTVEALQDVLREKGTAHFIKKVPTYEPPAE